MGIFAKAFEYLTKGITLVLGAGFCVWIAKQTFIVDPQIYHKPRFKTLDAYLTDVSSGEMGKALAKSYLDRRPAGSSEDKDIIYKIYHACLITEAFAMLSTHDKALSREVSFKDLEFMGQEFERRCKVD